MHALTMAAYALSAVLAGGSAEVCQQVDTFSDGTLMSWGGGQTPLANIADGGPLGAGDNYLQVSAEDFHLAFKNSTQWSGDYSGHGVTAIGIDLNVLSASDDVEMRLVLWGFDGGVWASTSTMLISPGWNSYVFELNDTALTYVEGGSGDLADVMSDVMRLQFRHDPGVSPTSPMGHPEHITATLGVDNVRCIPEPGVFVLLTAGMLTLLYRKR